MAQYDINIRDYWRIIRKRRTVIIFTTVLLALFSFVFGKLNEPIPIYSAASAVKFQRSTTVAGLVAEAFTFAPTDEIATQMVIARSYPIIEEVAKGLKLIDPNLSSEKIRSDSRLVSIVNRLRKQVSVEQQGETNIMTLRATSTDPKLAARMANTSCDRPAGSGHRVRAGKSVWGRMASVSSSGRTPRQHNASSGARKTPSSTVPAAGV